MKKNVLGEMWDIIKCANAHTMQTAHHMQEKPDMIYSLFLVRNNGCYKAVERGSKEWVNPG